MDVRILLSRAILITNRMGRRLRNPGLWAAKCLILAGWAFILSAGAVPADEGVTLSDPSLPPIVGVWEQSPDEAVARYTGSLDARGEHYEGEIQLQHIKLYCFRNITRTIDGNDEILSFQGTIETQVPYFHLAAGNQDQTIENASVDDVADIRIRVKGKAGRTTGTFSLLLESFTVLLKARSATGESIDFIAVRNVPDKNSTGEITIVDRGNGTYLITGYLDAFTEGAVVPLSAVDYFEDVNGPVHLVLHALETTPTDLAVTQTAAPDPVYAGANLTYTLTVKNRGPAKAESVVLTDVLPAGATFVAAYAYDSDQADCTASGVNLSCTLGSLYTDKSLTVKVVMTAPDAAELTNTARVTCMADDPDLTNNVSTLTTAVAAATDSSDLAVGQVASPSPAVLDEKLTYTLTVVNNGPSDAVAVILTDILPYNIDKYNLSAVPDQGMGHCAIYGEVGPFFYESPVVSCSLGSLTAGSTWTVVITGYPEEAVNMINRAVVTSQTPDADRTNNESSLVMAASPTDLSLSQTAHPDPVFFGNQATFTITVTNKGPNEAEYVDLINTLSDNASLVSVTTTEGECYWGARVMDCYLGNLDPEETVTVTVVAKPLSGSTITNEAHLETETPDAAPADNTSTVTIGITYPVKGDLRNTGTAALADAVLALQVIAGMQPSGIREDYAASGTDVNGDNKIGLAEAIYIMQSVTELR
ncbi:MAG: DUF11 domain-containing protein [Deltaproteobacteria bacterium]|nr:DUF11 domain-containing protein [Deltaproteobacteria bacterium]